MDRDIQAICSTPQHTETLNEVVPPSRTNGLNFSIAKDNQLGVNDGIIKLDDFSSAVLQVYASM